MMTRLTPEAAREVLQVARVEYTKAPVGLDDPIHDVWWRLVCLLGDAAGEQVDDLRPSRRVPYHELVSDAAVLQSERVGGGR